MNEVKTIHGSAAVISGTATTEVRYLGPEGARIITVTHRPAGPVRGAVVIASPIQSEYLKNNRREVLIGRELAERGIAVRRFHYRGMGLSLIHISEPTRPY